MMLSNRGLDSGAREADAHNELQAWRRSNPDGYVLNIKLTTKFKLHHLDCRRLAGNDLTEAC